MNKVLTLLNVALLTACGGGDSSGVASSPGPAESIASTDSTTSELSVPNGFDYRTQIAAGLDITLNNLPAGEHYLSLYSRYLQLDDGSLQPERASKLLSAQLTDGRLSTGLVLPSAAEVLLLEVWTRGQSEPIRRLVRVNQTERTDSSVNVTDE
jgi:hypothetical protein